MPKKTKTVTTQIVGDEEEEQEQDQQRETDDSAMEEAVLDFAAGERVVKLYRYPGDLGGRPRFLGPIARPDFNEVFIQDAFGGGRYFGRWRNKAGKYTRFTFEIEGEPKVFTRAQERQQEREDDDPYRPRHEEDPQAGQGMSTFDVLRMIAETRKESREEMRMMLEMMRPAQQAPDATEKVFSLVEKLAPLISAGGGDGGGNGNPWLFALSQLKEPLMKIVDTIQVAVTKPAPVPQPGPTKVPQVMEKQPAPNPTPEPAPEPKGDDAMLLDTLTSYLPMLLKAADDKRDPGFYSDWVLDQVPVFAYDRLRVWLLKPGCLDQIEAVSPRPFTTDERLWWEALRGNLVQSLNEELGDGIRSLHPVTDTESSTGDSAPRDEAG